jgi:hypothetical protein
MLISESELEKREKAGHEMQQIGYCAGSEHGFGIDCRGMELVVIDDNTTKETLLIVDDLHLYDGYRSKNGKSQW